MRSLGQFSRVRNQRGSGGTLASRGMKSEGALKLDPFFYLVHSSKKNDPITVADDDGCLARIQMKRDRLTCGTKRKNKFQEQKATRDMSAAK